MKRREMLLSTAAAVLGMSATGFRRAAAANNKRQKVLYFTRSAAYEHSAVGRDGDKLSISEQVLTDLGKQHDTEVVCTKDGRVFDGDLDQYDAIAFYTQGDLTRPNERKTPPMTPRGKRRLLQAIAAGKGFVGFHSATDTFHSKGPKQIDPYIKMIGGEFVSHGPQQEATMRVTSPEFPGICELDLGDSFTLLEEWYAMKYFADDLHVILVQETKGMKGGCYHRPPFPSTWARMHGKGRVFYTALGHRHDIWTNEDVQRGIVGAVAWAMGNIDFDIPPNINKVAPKANQTKTAD